MGGQLGLTRRQLEPAFAALYFYGNTSSSSYWYSFGFAESRQGICKGDRVWQAGFGSGFKQNSAVWKALRSFREPRHKAWAEVTNDQVEEMWSDLERMGVRFVDGVMPPYAAKKKPACHPSNAPTLNGHAAAATATQDRPLPQSAPACLAEATADATSNGHAKAADYESDESKGVARNGQRGTFVAGNEVGGMPSGPVKEVVMA